MWIDLAHALESLARAFWALIDGAAFYVAVRWRWCRRERVRASRLIPRGAQR